MDTVSSLSIPKQINHTITAGELKKGDTCIIKNKIYTITEILIIPTMSITNPYSQINVMLQWQDGKSKTERSYQSNFQINQKNGYIIME